KTPERQFSGHAAAVTAVAVSADGQTIASGGQTGIVRFWNRTKGEQTGTLGAHAGAVTSLVFTPAGQVLSCSLDGSLKLWQVPVASSKHTLAHGEVVTSAALSADGGKLLTGCVDKQVRLWNTTSGAVEKTFAGPTLAVQTVALSPRGD